MFNHADYVDRGVGCYNCHSDAIKGDAEVPRQMCWNCHNQPAQIARYSDATFVHQVHVTDNKVECASCHIEIEHHIDAGAPRSFQVLGEGPMLDHGGACGQCHASTHAGPDEMYRGTGGRGVPDMPSPMFRAQVDCIACHQTRLRDEAEARIVGQTYAAAQASCNYCHGDRYRDTLDLWKGTIERLLADAEVAVEAARLAMERSELEPAASLQRQRLFADATHNVRFVRLGQGVHNVNYASALLNIAIERAREVEGMSAEGATRRLSD
jgi:hypothetical protein